MQFVGGTGGGLPWSRGIQLFMNETQFLTFAWTWTGIGLLVFPLTLGITAPFGRHHHGRSGPSVDNRWGWIVMESPAWICFPLVFLGTLTEGHSTACWIAGLWMAHYLHRGLLYPFRIRTKGKRIPLLVVGSGFVFQLVNAGLNGAALGAFGGAYTAEWTGELNFMAGTAVFLAGGWLNLRSDEVLLRLRRGSEGGYSIPRGGFFKWVSCPNFLGEILQWIGWAILCWNAAALSFAVWTAANLLPRAIAHHRWYQNRFPDYPPERKAVFPGLL